MSATDDMIAANAAYAEAFDRGDLAAPPARRVAVLTCMDARIDPARALGLEEGDAHVIRNAGGVVSDDAIRSLAISQHLLGTEEVVLIQHTECGMIGLTDEEFAKRTGAPPPWPLHGIDDLEESVRRSTKRIVDEALIPSSKVRGFVYDVRTGALREVAS